MRRPLRPLRSTASTASEEFYYNDGKLVYVYAEPDGATKSDPHVETSGDKFYFGSEGMFAWIKADGTRVDLTDPEFAKWSAQILKESDRFASTMQP